MKRHRAIALVFIAAAGAVGIAAACAPLMDIPLNVCGNAIIELPNEQCDTFPRATDDAGNTCYPADAGTGLACHFACAKGTLACQKGWACGTDTVCRKPSGAFQRVGPAISSNVRELGVGDFNGDRLADVLTRGAGTTSVHFFDETGTLTTTTSISVSRGSFAIGDLTGAGLASLAVLDSVIPQRTPEAGVTITGTGIDLWRGQNDRSLAVTLFESFPIPKAQDARMIPASAGLAGSQLGGDDLFVFGQAALGDSGFVGSLGYVDPANGFTQLYLLPSTQSKLVGNVGAARFNKSAPCDSLIGGLANDARAYVYQTCTPMEGGAPLPNTTSTPPPAIITFGVTLQGPLLVIDTNADGNLDVLTGAREGGEWGIEVALGKGDGTFKPPTFAQVHGSLGKPLLTGPVLAVGYVDGDSKLDFVDADGVALSGLPGMIAATGIVLDAKIADLNTNGLVDVVAISADGIDFYNGTGTPLMNHRFYDVPATGSLTVGDMDGDFNADLVVASSATPSSISILYGQLDGYPQPPQSVGSLPITYSLASGHLTWLFGDPPDLISSIVAISGGSTGLAAVPIQGHADRQLTSPLILSRSLSARDVPIAAAVANLASAFDASTLAVLAATVPSVGPLLDCHLWAAPADPNSVSVLSPPTVPSDSSASFSANGNVRSAALAAIDLDPAKRNGDEIVVAVPANEETMGAFYVLSFDGSSTWSMPSPEQQYTGRARIVQGAIVPLKVGLADFDGDGLIDLLIVHGDKSATSTDSQVLADVIFNDGSGSLDLSKAVALPIPNGAGGAASINAFGDGTMQVAVVMSITGEVNLVAFAKGTRTPTWISTDAGAPIGLAGAIDLVAGDVNGDGVNDIVVASATQFVVSLGVPVVK